MLLEGISYVPTLAVRAGEMNGLEYLPGVTKDRMQPCFLLAPWVNSLSLDKAVGRIENAFPNRPYFLDLDRNYYSDREAEAQWEFESLKDPANAYENWIAFVARFSMIWPCIQTQDQSRQEIRHQIRSVQGLSRPYCLRICRDREPPKLDEVLDAFAEGPSDFAIILEAGSSFDLLNTEHWLDSLFTRVLRKIDASVPIIPSWTSMPGEYSDYNNVTPTPVGFENRKIMKRLEARHNRARTIYGDWGSTRPRDPASKAPRSRPLDRIDYPLSDAWLIARNKDQQWTFRNAAQAILKSPLWNGYLGLWGEEMIKNTAINQEIGINSPPKNIAARVNIHLHRQAFYDEPPPAPTAMDESWED